MPLTGMEPILDKLKTELSTYLPARIVTEAALAPVLTMPAPGDYFFDDRQEMPTLSPDSPIVVVAPRTTDPQFEKLRTFNDMHRVSVGIYVMHADEETLSRLLLRYVEAISKTLLDRADADTLGFELLFDEPWGYSPQRVADLDLFQRDASLPIGCWISEVR